MRKNGETRIGNRRHETIDLRFKEAS